jgi:glycolate oxidase FAD binding subunit
MNASTPGPDPLPGNAATPPDQEAPCTRLVDTRGGRSAPTDDEFFPGWKPPGPPLQPPVLPTTVDELADAVRSYPRVLAVGAGTKPRLSLVAPDVQRISTTKVTGIVDYEPSEFTFTARAGTPLREIEAVLAERGQYLPFDPPLAEAGATLGGTVAAGLSGAGSFRYGRLRDFILGVKFIDGDGRQLRLGGRVVKNAAGFDVPKFLVGSLGRLAVLAELTFKVFPRPPATLTLRLKAMDGEVKQQIFIEAGLKRWELDALESPIEEDFVYARLAGPPEALPGLAAEVKSVFPGDVLAPEVADEYWRASARFAWAAKDSSVSKVLMMPDEVQQMIFRMVQLENTVRGRITSGAAVAYLSSRPTILSNLPWRGVRLRGAGPLWFRKKPTEDIFAPVKAVFDPPGRFPDLGE